MRRTAVIRASSAIIASTLICACSPLLDEDFESYNAGSAPGGAIPGGPNCDSIVIHGDAAQFSIGPENAIEGSQSLSFEPAFGSGESLIDFIPCPATDNDRSLIVRWRGRLFAPSQSPGVQASIYNPEEVDSPDESLGAFIHFEIRRDRIVVGSSGIGLHAVDGDFRMAHTIIVRLVPSTNRYHVAIAGGGVSGGNRVVEGDLPNFLDFEPLGVILRMRWMFGAGVSENYYVDEVNISQRN